MNANRRKQISALVSSLEEIIAQAETLRDEEREYYDNMPENMQQGERGQAASDAVDALDSLVSDLESARDNADSAANV